METIQVDVEKDGVTLEERKFSFALKLAMAVLGLFLILFTVSWIMSEYDREKERSMMLGMWRDLSACGQLSSHVLLNSNR
jgi:hypothetical protein